jgi:hypothetical protein
MLRSSHSAPYALADNLVTSNASNIFYFIKLVKILSALLSAKLFLPKFGVGFAIKLLEELLEGMPWKGNF